MSDGFGDETADGEIEQSAASEAARIRTYEEKEINGVDVPNQIMWDLRGTFGWRAVAYRNEEGDVVDWFAHHPEINEVVCWWPDYYDNPVWMKESIYAFVTALEYGYATLHEWPNDLDEDAEVVFG